MSLATRCTQCGTIFKVVQDQLKVSEGWVRCGRCHEVFNALEGLFDLEREAPPARVMPPEPATAPPTESAAFAQPQPDTAEVPTAPMPLADLPSASPPEPTPDPAPEPAPAVKDPLPQDPPHPGVTHFDLDLPPSDHARWPAPQAPAEPFSTQDLDNPVDLGSLSGLRELMPPSPMGEPEPIYPETSETDALDSRYLLPNEGASNKRPRRRRGPEFADAQFPQDLQATDPWEDDPWVSGAGQLDEVPIHRPAVPQAPHALDAVDALGNSGTTGVPPITAHVARASSAAAAPESPRLEDDGPSTVPSRFAEDFQPESALPPPSQRKGKPGTRGRAPQTEAPGFIKQAERKAIWRHPLVRGVLSLLALALTLLLAGQAVHHWRDPLAAYQPDAAPWLAQWCKLAGCQIQPPRQLDDLQVDNIQLVRTSSEGADTYRLTVIVHNRAEVPLRWPQLDLTLTDPNGQVVVRRLFSTVDARQVLSADANAPKDQPPPTVAVPPTVPANSLTTVQWQLRAPDLKLAGYTAELFYP